MNVRLGVKNTDTLGLFGNGMHMRNTERDSVTCHNGYMLFL